MNPALLYAALAMASVGAPVTADGLRRVMAAMGAPCPEADALLVEALAQRIADAARRTPPPTPSPAPGTVRPSPAPDGGAPVPPGSRSAGERREGPVATGAGAGCRLYVYALVPEDLPWVPTPGVDGREVYALRAAGIAALVHEEPADAPLPGEGPVDVAALAAQAAAHDAVVVRAWTEARAVLPMRLNTRVRAGADADAVASLRRWLDREARRLSARLELLRDRAEYGVEVRWAQADAPQGGEEEDPEVVRLLSEMAGRPESVRRLYRHRLDRALRDRADRRRRRLAEEVRAALAPLCADVRDDPPRLVEADDGLILRLALLVDEGGAARVGEALEAFAARPDVHVRFTGPWPPYTFAAVGAPGA
jgi:hypothetical protein